jgi:hypothetical protein
MEALPGRSQDQEAEPDYLWVRAVFGKLLRGRRVSQISGEGLHQLPVKLGVGVAEDEVIGLRNEALERFRIDYFLSGSEPAFGLYRHTRRDVCI